MHKTACIRNGRGRQLGWVDHGVSVRLFISMCYTLSEASVGSILAQPCALYPLILLSTHQATRWYSLALWFLFTWASLAGDWFPFRFQKSRSLAGWLFLVPPKKKFSIYPSPIYFWLPYCLPATVLWPPQQVRAKASKQGSRCSLQPQFFKICFLH